MALTWLPVFLICIGGALACVTDEGCDNINIKAMAAQTANDLDEYCRVIKNYIDCVKESMKTCDPVTLSSVIGPLEAGYNQTCGSAGSPVQSCQMKVYTCYPALAAANNNTNNPVLQCSGLKDYLICGNENMKTCDPSVKRSDVIGPIEASYDLMCRAGGRGYCPGVSTCMQPLMSMSSTSTTQQPNAVQGGQPNMPLGNYNIIQECSKTGDLMKCMGTELSKCNITSPRSYTFKDVGELYITGCRLVMGNTALQTCSHMTTCIANITFLTDHDQSDISRQFYDPKFWCSLINSTMACAESSNQCQADRTDITTHLEKVKKVCNEGTDDNVSGAQVVRAGILIVLSAINVMLLSRQL